MRMGTCIIGRVNAPERRLAPMHCMAEGKTRSAVADVPKLGIRRQEETRRRL